MSRAHERIQAELENVARTLAALPETGGAALPVLSPLELAGVGALLHDFYNGVENILKQRVSAAGLDVPSGPSWHRELLALATSKGLISGELADQLKPYMAFRHFFAHGYSLDLVPERLAPLVDTTRRVFRELERETGVAGIPGAAHKPL